MSWKDKRNRIFKIGIVIVVIIGALIACGAEQPKKEVENKEARNQYAGVAYYEVKANDTLSNIAYSIVPPEQSVKQWISDVKRINERTDDIVYFKENLKIFVFEE